MVVGVSTDKSSYIKGDKIILQVTMNRPAEGTITVSTTKRFSANIHLPDLFGNERRACDTNTNRVPAIRDLHCECICRRLLQFLQHRDRYLLGWPQHLLGVDPVVRRTSTIFCDLTS